MFLEFIMRTIHSRIVNAFPNIQLRPALSFSTNRMVDILKSALLSCAFHQLDDSRSGSLISRCTGYPWRSWKTRKSKPRTLTDFPYTLSASCCVHQASPKQNFPKIMLAYANDYPPHSSLNFVTKIFDTNARKFNGS